MNYSYTPHPKLATRKERHPAVVKQMHRRGNTFQKFNAFIAVKITDGVATMWCAYLFTLLALISLPGAIRGGIPTLIAWTAQTFIQLVLLSIIMVGQKVSARAADKRAEDTYTDTEIILHEVREIHLHLDHQDALLQAPGKEAPLG